MTRDELQASVAAAISEARNSRNRWTNLDLAEAAIAVVLEAACDALNDYDDRIEWYSEDHRAIEERIRALMPEKTR